MYTYNLFDVFVQYFIRVQIKHITIAKCGLFFHYCDAKEISFYNFHKTKLSGKHEK